MACRKLGIGAAAILIMAAAAAAEEKPAADLCVALLQAEYISPDSNTDGNELTGRLDTVLIEALSKQENITLVDRQLLDKVLAEKKLQKLDADTADEKLKPFIASGILICPTIVADSKSKQAVITIHAVLAQRGDLLAELVVKQDISGKASDALADIDKPLQQFLREMRQQTENRAGVPTFEVRHIAMAGKLSRIQWMADDLTDALAAEHYNGLVLLVPRQPVHTKEERLLRLMGLSRPDNGDASAKFSAASDYQISGEMSEETKQGISFEQTPVTILLRLTGGRRDISSTKLTGTVGDYSQLRTKALDWAAEALPKAGGVSPKTLDESHAKELAQTELETARRLAAIKYSGGAMERDRQERLALAALRAAHLDPTCEEASYLVVQSIDGLYDSRGQMRTLACWDRLIQESQKYIDCFGDRIPQHHVQVLERMSHAGFRGNGLLQPTPRRTEDILSPPNERRWRYIRAYVLANLESGVRGVTDSTYADSNALQSMGGHIRLHMIPNIPDDRLDEEYAFWRKFWRQRVEPLGEGKAIPWDCVEMGFAARRKDPAAVRAAAQRLAEKYPKSRNDIWRLLLDNTVSLYLRAAGDKECSTWQPVFAQPDPPKIDIAAARAFYSEWRRPMPTAWDYSGASALPGARIMFQQDSVAAGKSGCCIPYPKIECFMLAGGDAWCACKCLWDNFGKPHHLMVIPVKTAAGRSDVEVAPAEVPWPDDPAKGAASEPADESNLAFAECWAVTTDSKGNDTVWIGTRRRGLARFDKKDGKWTGKWYASRQGMPSEYIKYIAAFHIKDGWKLVLAGEGPKSSSGTKLFFWSLDVQSDGVKLLGDMAMTWSMGALTAVWPDGRRLPLFAAGQFAYEGMEADDISNIVTAGPPIPDWPVESFSLRFMRAADTMRLWRIGNGRRACIAEMSAESLDVLDSPAISGPVTVMENGSVPSPCQFSRLAWHDLSEGLPTGPLDKLCSSLVVGRDIWLVVRPYEHVQHRGEGFYIMVYRPAQQGDRNWADHDRWLGPFKLAKDSTIFRLAGEGDEFVWATGENAVYRIDVKVFLQQAGREGMGISTAQWRQSFEKRLEQADWPVRLRVMLARKQFEPALELVEKQLGESGKESGQTEKIAWTQAMMHKALVLACMERWNDSLAVYTQVRENGVEAGRRAAGREIMWLFAVTQQWQKFLEEVEAQGLKPEEGTILYFYVRQARAEIEKASPKTPSEN